MNDEEIIKSLTKKQRENLNDVYEQYQKTGFKYGDKGRRLGTGLKTGCVLYRKGLVNLSAFQLTDWTMWEITENGIRIAKMISK